MQRIEKKKILIVTGSSGGHIFPALAFLEDLKSRCNSLDLHLVLPRSTRIKNDLEKNNIKVSYISISNLKLDIKILCRLFNFLKGILETIFILVQFRPNLVVGFGSLICVPVIILAHSLGIRTLIHEQNVILGRANRLLMRFSDKVAVSFHQTLNYLNGCQDKVVVTGNPLRKELVHMEKGKALDFFGLKEGKPTLLVMGGSQGSHRINFGFLKALLSLSERSKLQIIHITGLEDYDLLRNHYQNLNVRAVVFDFLRDMQYAYNASDLAICRAGAITITELIYFGVPAIIVPYPYAYQHQLANAKILEKAGCAYIVNDDELDTDKLKNILEMLIDNPNRLEAVRLGYKGLARFNANDLLLQEALRILFI